MPDKDNQEDDFALTRIFHQPSAEAARPMLDVRRDMRKAGVAQSIGN